MKQKKPFDFWIFMTVVILLSLGIIMVFSASAAFAYNYMKGDTYYFLKRQLIYSLLGFGAMIFTLNIDYKKWGKWTPIFLAVSIILLILVRVPGLGRETKGAWRWFYVGEFSFQPSEIAKLAVILFFSHSLSRNKDQLKFFIKGLMPYLAVIGVFAALLMLQPHLSGTMIIVFVCLILLFCAGAKIKHFLYIAAPGATLVVAAIAFSDYRRARVLAFLDPWKDVQGDGWQVVQSLYAIGSGGIFGRGLGRSLQKFLYIPEPHNDFIFSVLAEELGYIGVVAVLLLFIIFIWRGIKVAVHAPDMFGSLVAVGITSLIAFQVIINIAVVTSSMPVTGMPLPFFSYGGTSLIFLMSGIGILLNISKHANYERI